MRWQEELNERRLKTHGWYGCIAPDGWKWIIEDLDAKLTYLDPDYEIHQVKEKFGTLRYYYGSTKSGIIQDLMDDAVAMAESLSASTCEVCGNSSRISNKARGISYDSTAKLKTRKIDGWYKTICDSCDVGELFNNPLSDYKEGYADGKSDKEGQLIANVNALINSVVDYGLGDKYERVVADLTKVIKGGAE